MNGFRAAATAVPSRPPDERSKAAWAENSKLQNPSSKQSAKKFETQKNERRAHSVSTISPSLEFIWSLELGTWDLEFLSRAALLRSPRAAADNGWKTRSSQNPSSKQSAKKFETQKNERRAQSVSTISPF
ncbi:MAG TPA: hypothetical protein VEO95_13390, partial [Chthoniobacteraceae bacterium]|nr:hypothetical protein [Chthoniobacteraceae bacterium]